MMQLISGRWLPGHLVAVPHCYGAYARSLRASAIGAWRAPGLGRKVILLIWFSGPDITYGITGSFPVSPTTLKRPGENPSFLISKADVPKKIRLRPLVFFCLKPHRVRDDNALKCCYQHGTKNQAGHSAAHPRQARSRLRIERVPQARYCDGSWPLAKQRHIPLARRFMVAQDIDAAVVDLYFEVTAIGGEPTVDDFHYRDAAFSQVKGAGLVFAPVAGVALHSDLHLPMSSGFETTAAFPLDAVQNN